MLTRRFYRLLSRGWWLRLCPNQSTKLQQAKSRETRQPHQAETRRLHRVETSRADPGISRVDLVVSRVHRAGIGRADLGMGWVVLGVVVCRWLISLLMRCCRRSGLVRMCE